VLVEWHCCNVSYIDLVGKASSNCTGIAKAMIEIVSENYCFEHCMKMLMKLNFSALSTETAVPCEHAPSRDVQPSMEESGCHSSK
jgi:hypothetical protein